MRHRIALLIRALILDALPEVDVVVYDLPEPPKS